MKKLAKYVILYLSLQLAKQVMKAVPNFIQSIQGQLKQVTKQLIFYARTIMSRYVPKMAVLVYKCYWMNEYCDYKINLKLKYYQRKS